MARVGQGLESIAKLAATLRVLKLWIRQSTNSHLLAQQISSEHSPFSRFCDDGCYWVCPSKMPFTPEICPGKQMWRDMGTHVSELWNVLQELEKFKTSLRYENAMDKWNTQRHPTSLKVNVKRYANFHLSHYQTSYAGQTACCV